MKSRYIKLILFVIPFFIFSCIENDVEVLKDQGSTFVSIENSPVRNLFYDAFTDIRKIDLVSVRRNVPSEAALNSSSTVTLVAAPEILEQYNEENEENFEWLPNEIFTVLTAPGVSVSGSNLTMNFGPGEFAKEYTINLDGSKWDLAHKYAVVYKIVDGGGADVSGDNYIMTFISAKNAYDGIYRYQSSSEQTLMPDQDTEVQLHTVSPTKVKLIPGLVGYYSNEVWYTVNPETNQVEVEMNTLLPIINTPESTYDPATKTFKLYWYSGGGNRYFEETLTFIKSR